ncbi:voltage-gated potassium channel [Anaeromyces robustus]|uniref:Voltage-gated potassium channel n=1 Tax=Anaeromyces robustus TaxID=1754192 RepID=A0A1Y1X121_9FUNG|nr:voltage-gated potassium channel [Anaeromyces robustus]|eukprot:ORX79298.1 voltage-gated potassium channel [Anaeromyces robustus]
MDNNKENDAVIISIKDDDDDGNNKKTSNDNDYRSNSKGIRKRLFEIIEVAEAGDIVSSIYDFYMITAIVVSLVPLGFKGDYTVFIYTDIVAVSIFILDYILRMITADYKMNKKSILSFIKYPFTFWAIIDLLSILPSITIIYDGLKLLRIFNLIKTLRIIRAFKAFRYSRSVTLIADVIKTSSSPLSAVATLAIGYILMSALIIFNIEPDTFENFFFAIYWATVSLTTVGYGDIYPLSNEGKAISMISSLFGVALIALPAGIITAGYMDSLTSFLEEKKEKAQLKNIVSKSNNELLESETV